MDNRWFDDTFLTKKLDIHEHLNNLQNYHKRMMDKYNIGEKKLKSIIKNVTFVDDTHSKIWANINTELDLVLNKIKALNEVIQPSNLAYISKDTLKARLDKVDSNFDKGMNATNDNIKLLNKKIEEELYPPEWWESALSGAEGFTVSLIRNAVVDPFIFLGEILTADGTTVTKDVATRLLFDNLNEWLGKHTFYKDAYQTGSQIGGFTSGMIQICQVISGQFMIDLGIGGETLGAFLMSTGAGVVVGGAIGVASWSLVLEGTGVLAMGVLGAGSHLDEGTTPKDEHKEEPKELQDVDTNIDPVKEGASGAGLNKKLMNELAESGVKYNVDDVVMITKNSDGKLLWLEKGTDSSGLKHIIDGKATNFADRGITDIPKFLEETLKTKPVRIGSNSKGNYAEYIMNGKEYTVAYGTNGYIVSFYPSGN